MNIVKADELTKLLLDYYKKKSAWATQEKHNHLEYLQELSSKFSKGANKNGLSSFKIREYQENTTFIREMYEYFKKLEDYFELKISELEKTGYALNQKDGPVN